MNASRIVILMLISTTARAIPLDSLTTRYRKGLNTDLWQAAIHYDRSESPLSLIRLRENGYLSRLRVNETQNKWKTRDELQFRLIRPFSSTLGWQFNTNGLVFTDQQTGFINDIRTHAMGAGLRYYKYPFLIPILAGIKDDQRFEQEDQGLYGQVQCFIDPVKWGEYTHSLNSEYMTDRLNKRKNRGITVQYQVHRQFYGDTKDTLAYSFSRQRRDYYISTAGDIESREEQDHMLSNKLFYRLNSSLFYILHGTLSQRRLQFNQLTGAYTGPKRRRNDFRLSGGINLVWHTNSLYGNLYMDFAEEEQTYELWETETTSQFSGLSTLRTPDNYSKISYMAANTSWRISLSDTLEAHTSILKTEYNTPDKKNTDDRDEIRFRTDLQYTHRFSDALLTRWDVSMHMHHLVYLDGGKSAENNWSRIIKFTPALTWNPAERIRVSHATEVLANYVDYDFDEELAGIRSFLYRKLKLEDTLQVQISELTDLQTIFKLEIDENGKLVWRKWLEQRLMDRRSQNIRGILIFKPVRNFKIGAGYTYYIRKGYRYQTEHSETVREKNLDFRSHGPVMSMHYLGHHFYLNITGSSILTRTQSAHKQLLTRIDLNMRWMF